MGNALVNLIAQTLPTVPTEPRSNFEILIGHLMAATIFSLVGIVVFFVCLLIMEKITPFSILKEIGEEHNQAVAMIVSAIVLGIAIIIAAAILG